MRPIIIMAVLSAACTSEYPAGQTADTAALHVRGQCYGLGTGAIERLVGYKVRPSKPLAYDPTAECSWDEISGHGHVQITILPEEYHNPPIRAEGFQEAPEHGEQAYVVPELDGWKAGTIARQRAYIIQVSGPKVTAGTALALLDMAVAEAELPS